MTVSEHPVQHSGVTVAPRQPERICLGWSASLSVDGDHASARQSTKRVVFLGGSAVVAFVVGLGAVTVSYRLAAGPVVCGTRLCSGARPYTPVALCAASALAVILVSSRPDSLREQRGWVEEWLRAARDATLAGLVVVLFAFFWRPDALSRSTPYSREILVLEWVVSFIGLGLLRVGLKSTLITFRRRGNNLINAVVVGSSPSARSFIEVVEASPETGYRVVAHLDDRETGPNLVRALHQIAATHTVDEVVLATRSLGREDVSTLVSSGPLRKSKIRAIPELFGLPPAKVEVAPVLGDFPMLSLFTVPLRGPRRSLKRAVDLIVATLGIVVTSPILLLSALAIRATSSGPVLFRQDRIGMDGRPFEMLKFRTMYENTDAGLHQKYMTSLLRSDEIRPSGNGLYKLTDDPRITPVGRVLRRLSLDELPQLVNVLRGEMSLVGPRPALAFEVELYEEWQRARLSVRPGVTGLWQVSGRCRLTATDMLRLDVRYAETCSFMLDLSIILKTFPALLRREAQ